MSKLNKIETELINSKALAYASWQRDFDSANNGYIAGATHYAEKAKALAEALDNLLASINPHDHPAKSYFEWDGRRVGSKTIPTDAVIINAKQALTNYKL